MQIRKSSNTTIYLFIAFSLIAILVLGVALTFNKPQIQAVIETKFAKDNDATKIQTTVISIANLIKTDRSYLYKNDELYIFATQEGLEPRITFAYKTPLTERALNDIYYIHLYLKDSEILSTPFYNITFEDPGKAEELTVDGDTYLLYTKPLLSSSFKDGVIAFDNINFINIGRFDRLKGRSLDAQNLVVEKVQIEKNTPKIVVSKNASTIEVLPLKTIEVYAKETDFSKIRLKRDDALKKDVLLTTDDDFINGEISLENGEKLKTKFRLKGDWTDHLNSENQWSYRFILKNEATLLGMRKFSIQHPKTRNYQWEWLFNRVIKDEGVIGLRYDFVYFNQHIISDKNVEYIDNKVMALEESFDKILIENNKKREGVIIAFDESLLWEDRQYGKLLGQPTYPLIGNRALAETAKIKVYNENKVLSNPALKKQFIVAKDLLEGLRTEKYKISEVFDIEKLTMYVALCNVFGGGHGLTWHNLRIYYNPVTNKLEPISFDSVGGYQIDTLTHYPYAEDDPVYITKLAEKLKLVSSQEYINAITDKYSLQLNQLTTTLNKIYPEYIFDINTLAYNSNFIKKLIFPVNLVNADVVSYSKKILSVEINNLNDFYVSIDKLIDLDGKKLDLERAAPLLIKPKETRIVDIKLKNAFNNAFVSKKNKKGGFTYPKDISNLRLSGSIEGVWFNYENEIGATASNPKFEEDIEYYKKSNSASYNSFTFIEKGKDTTTIVFKKGDHLLSKNLKIPVGKTVIIEPGFNLDFTNNASIISKSAIIAKGTLKDPIIFYSKNATGGGLFIDRAKTKSLIEHCTFTNLSNPQNEQWSISGAVNFYESEVTITNCTFEENRCEDALNIIRGTFEMSNTQFLSTFSDSFDGDFVSGTLTNCQFYNSGNDAIDISGSQLMLKDILIENPLDKGISAGENSAIRGENITINDGEIGIVSKDLSEVVLKNVIIYNTRLGFSAFQKKSEYGKASITITQLSKLETETAYLIESGCKLVIDEQLMPTVSNNVIDQMYGVEYGKSTK